MAHFTELDSNNIVLRVLVVNNDDCLDENNNESENVGIAFLQNLYGNNTIWKQTSYNANIRKNYAAIGYNYNSNRDAFIPPKPFNSWNLDEITCKWLPPTPMPTDTTKLWAWNEDTLSWIGTSKEEVK
jgi:hypothetical protein